ncbi:lisH domain-containing protein ARMC9-like isoform X2 [Ostrea edulis]|uniref:lisH domain-containing protein ARMC9-like isoform X2 n=1 Tax=Ostrea edulis TaxID=37623 RepID=UPI0024AE8D12|nr:lisH domain-containing protein ARMC9-like isoform X2 [Ostrea edulis]
MSGSLSVVSFEGELNAIVQEYLEFSGFDKCTSVFQKECEQKSKPIATHGIKSKSNQKLVAIQNELMQHFHKGRRERFFKEWNDNLHPSVRDGDAVAKKLEFYLNIYFATFPIKFARGQREADRAMGDFKKYLETRGASLSQTTEFLPFYALPFVPNAKSHPSYKELFTDSWVKDLEVRVEKFLTLTLKSRPQPKLFELYRGNKDGDETDQFQQISRLQQQLVDSERKTMSYIKRHNRVQADYHNLIGITADLVDALESTVQGKPITPEYLQEICSRLFSHHMSGSVDFTRPGTASQFLRQSIAPQIQPMQEPDAYPPVDYPKVKEDLAYGPNKRKALLLQAIRWRLTQSNPQQRDTTMTAYRDNDLLGCAKPGAHRTAVLGLLTSSDDMVKQTAARLFNAFASLCAGRTYLAQNQELFKALLDNLHSEERESITREMVLGALQKLSLRRNLQSSMIDAGLIEWLVKVLEDNDNLSDYTLEYSVALLMNLCLRTSGKKRCVGNAHQTLKVLSDLLGHENQEIRPYVNGALYSILAIPSIREEAKAMGMEEILRCFIKDDQPDMNRQIEFIIKQLNSVETVDEYESDDEEDDEEEEDQDAMELDLDKDEEIQIDDSDFTGEKLLTEEYQAIAGAKPKKKHLDTVMHEPLQRPITPSQRRATEHPSIIQSRPTSQLSQIPEGRMDMSRPPTRSGSRPNTQDGLRSASRASQLSQGSARVSKDNPEVKEYNQAFGSRPRIPRTPDVSSLGKGSQSVESVNQSRNSQGKVSQNSQGRNSQQNQGRTSQGSQGDGVSARRGSREMGSLSKVPRTPDSGKRPTSRGSISGMPPPQPQYSESGPRPSSAGKSAPPSRKGSVASQRDTAKTPEI